MTPREFFIYAEAYREKERERVEFQKQTIYSLSSLIARFVWAKRIPSYEKTFGAEAKKDMTDEELLAQAKSLNALFGGQVKGG